MPKKFDQNTKDRVVSLGGRPHSGGEYVHAGNMQNCGIQTGGARDILPGNGRRRLVVKDESLNTCRKTWQLKIPGHVVKTTSYGTPMSCCKLAQLFHVRTRPTTSVMIRFIDEHRDSFTIEFIFYRGEK